MNKGYTLTEILTCLVIVLVLSTAGTLGYQKFVDMGRAATCKSNLQMLNTAVEAYVGEHYAVPAVLGDLKLEHLQKAYAQVMEQTGWLVRFTQFVARNSMSGDVHAEFLTYENLKGYAGSRDFFVCPSDTNGGVSYGINANIRGKRWFEIGNNVVIVGDCDTPVFSGPGELRARHNSGRVALAVTKGKKVVRVENGVVTSEDGDTGAPAEFGVATGGGGSPASDDVDTGAGDSAGNETAGTETADAGSAPSADAASAAGNLVETVLGFGLPKDVENSYMGNLQSLQGFIEAGQINAATNELQAFVGKVQTDMTTGDISPENGNTVIAMANDLISELGN
jgi:prepilin-type N-terminal cleavage/methylation domain-containing protein